MEDLSKLKVGDGVTIKLYSDSHACTIVKTTGKTIFARRDRVKLLNGVRSKEKDALVCNPGGFVGHITGQQRYEYSRNSQGALYKIRLRKNGKYYLVHSKSQVLAGRHEHYDYNF